MIVPARGGTSSSGLCSRHAQEACTCSISVCRSVTRSAVGCSTSSTFGFDPDSAQRYDDGTVIIRNRDGFDLALHPGGRVGPLPEFLHFGFRFDDPDQVRSLLACLRADDVPIIEEHEESTYVAFKCLDPDGHRVEGYWELARSA